MKLNFVGKHWKLVTLQLCEMATKRKKDSDPLTTDTMSKAAASSIKTFEVAVEDIRTKKSRTGSAQIYASAH